MKAGFTLDSTEDQQADMIAAVLTKIAGSARTTNGVQITALCRMVAAAVAKAPPEAEDELLVFIISKIQEQLPQARLDHARELLEKVRENTTNLGDAPTKETP